MLAHQVQPLKPPTFRELCSSPFHRMCKLTGVMLLLGLTVNVGAQTLEELLRAPELTPASFARHFTEFQHEFHREVQPAEQFLATRRGDCDDYAVLADFVLRQHGYATRLIHVRLASRTAHAVCQVDGEKVYLDYNNRHYRFKLQRSKGRMREVATLVAIALQANWTSASEFTYDYTTNRKRIVQTVVKAAPAARDPDADHD